MTKTIRLDSLRKIQTWIGKQTGLETSISEAIEWLEKPENEGLKKGLALFVIRDTARFGTPVDLHRLAELGYDLKVSCTPQTDGNALHTACQYNKQGNALALIALGLRPQERAYATGPSAIEEAINNRHFKLVDKMLKHAPTPSEEQRVGFLKAALSATARNSSDNNDKPRSVAVEKVLERFGPFPQDVLDGALCRAASRGWYQAFEVLRKAGANPATPLSLIITECFGPTTACGVLFAKCSPVYWGRLIRKHAHIPEALFPSWASDAPQGVLDVDVILEKTKAKASRNLSNQEGSLEALQEIKATLQAERLTKAWEPPAVSKPRPRM